MSAEFTPSYTNYKDMKPFRFWCQKVLPAIYDDSLSYYELLCKVVDYLNDVIDNLEIVEGNTDSLLEAFTSLQEYVNNYFDSTDFQELVDDKLDEMVVDGSFESVLEPLLESYTSTVNQIMATQNQRIEVLEGRMDEFSSLPDGSTSGDAELADIRVGFNGVTYASAGDSVRAQATLLDNKISDAVHKKITSFNLFDLSKATTGYYIGSDGEPVSSTNTYFISDFIAITGGVRYFIANTENQGVAYYDSDKEFISLDTANHANATATPATAAFVRFTGISANISTTFCMPAEIRPYVINIIPDQQYVYSEGNVADEVVGEKKRYGTVVTTAQELCSAITAVGQFELPSNIITDIFLYEGNYALTRDMTSSVPESGTYGLQLPDNCNLIGMGKGAVISLNLTGDSASAQAYQSVLNADKNNELENITLVATNCRYALHNDSGNDNTDIVQKFVNCKFIHNGNSDGNWQYPAGVGEGTSSGANVIYENCEFVSPLRAYYLHNNVGFDKSSYHKFINCIFTCVDNGISFALESVNSGVNDIVELEGCTFNGIFDVRRSSSAPSGFDSNDFLIYGHANGGIKENFYFTDGKTYYVKSEDVITFKNNTGSTIPANTPIKIAENQYVPLAPSDTALACIGITIGAVNSNEIGAIRTNGYHRVIVSSTVGAKIGVVNGNISTVTEGDIIGVVKYVNGVYNRAYMKLCL